MPNKRARVENILVLINDLSQIYLKNVECAFHIISNLYPCHKILRILNKKFNIFYAFFV